VKPCIVAHFHVALAGRFKNVST